MIKIKFITALYFIIPSVPCLTILWQQLVSLLDSVDISMKKKAIIKVIAVITLFSASTASIAAGDAAAGKAKAASCISCHGADGISPNNLWPNLAGQKEGYLAKQLKAFRDGKRNDPMMASFAKNLSDQDIDDLSVYYASMK